MDQPAVNWTETQTAAIRTQLNRILASPEFAQSKRLCQFLQFIVDRALDGGTDCLKGYTIAVEVFERPATFDPAVDPIVRVMASRLRAKLHEYYHSEGCEELIEIDVPKGSYTPKIAFRQASVSAAAPGETIVQGREQMARPASALLRSTEDQPSLAVMPFVNISADPKHEYFADGITDDIITDLSKLSGLFVISRHSSFAYKATNKPLTEIAAAMRVRYLVEGSVRRQGDRARITANLVDTKSERSLWAERYDRDLTDIFAVQDDVAHSIVHALEIKLTGFEADRLGHEGTNSIEAHDALLRGLERFWLYTREGCIESQKQFHRAVELDPNYAYGHAWLARSYVYPWIMNWVPVIEQTLLPALVHAEKAVELDDLLPFSHSILGWVLLWRRDAQRAIAEGRRACALDTNNADAHIFLSYTLTATGRSAEGLRYIEKGMRLNPHPSCLYLQTLGLCYFAMAEYEKAIAAFNEGVEVNPMFLPHHTMLAVTYALLGREEEMRAERNVVLRVGPQASNLFFIDPALVELSQKGKQLAGLE